MNPVQWWYMWIPVVCGVAPDAFFPVGDFPSLASWSKSTTISFGRSGRTSTVSCTNQPFDLSVWFCRIHDQVLHQAHYVVHCPSKAHSFRPDGCWFEPRFPSQVVSHSTLLFLGFFAVFCFLAQPLCDWAAWIMEMAYPHFGIPITKGNVTFFAIQPKEPSLRRLTLRFPFLAFVMGGILCVTLLVVFLGGLLMIEYYLYRWLICYSHVMNTLYYY